MMNEQIDPETLRQMFHAYSVTTSVRIIAFVSAAALFVCVFEAVRRRRLREELTPIWLTWAIVMLLLASSFDLLIWLTDRLGAWTPSSTVFFLGVAFLTAISLHYAIRLSTLTDEVRRLAQELALLRAAGSDGRDRLTRD